VTIVRPAPDIGIYYFGLVLREWESVFSTMGRGATNQTELSRGQIGGVQILVPPRIIVQQFEDFAETSFRQAWVLMAQNQKLQTARNLLLSRLITGKMSVEDLDIHFPPSMLDSEPVDDKEADA
jgi:type I restriction enzyme, S subunit